MNLHSHHYVFSKSKISLPGSQMETHFLLKIVEFSLLFVNPMGSVFRLILCLRALFLK